jgi:hypothetical protein
VTQRERAWREFREVIAEQAREASVRRALAEIADDERVPAAVVLAEMIAEMDDDEDAAEESYLRGSGHVR